MKEGLLLIPSFYRSRIPETDNKSLQPSQERPLNLLTYYGLWLYAASNIEGMDGHHLPATG